ncbi:hypothetical protein [Amycolatopsis sp. CA-230715]|uniref:hypothetical protein n=1 Tax=Amycolatopsis sp. CA-230715 TaxID=2745196 RepID=UPI001C01D995|nr:hypothetical protein [Amycolatopsis sp. CA-230715]QWF81419.1 hypothetical protein HUW46_04850 [Amycolatopsis sp. CA-230715]
MRGRLPRTLALPVTAAMLALSATPALADTTIPTTPIPQPANPGQAPISSPSQPQPLGHAVGEAGTALGMLRLLPNAVTTGAILPGVGEQLPKQSALEGGVGLSSAQANSESYLTYERSIAQATPFGLSIAGNSPQAPGSLAQTALPDNPQPVSGGLNAPKNPLLNIGLLNGSAHARWSDTLGPCVDTISDASTSVANLSLLNVIPSLSGISLDQLNLPNGAKVEKGLNPTNPLSALGGLLSGGGQTQAQGSLVNVPNALSSRSVVKLVDMPGTKNKAVESTSTMQAAKVDILGGLFSVAVASQPTLKVTSTGDAKTSKVDYTAPVLKLMSGGKELFTFDASKPAEIPLGLPLSGLLEAQKAGTDQLKNVPVVNGLVDLVGGGLKPLTDAAKNFVLDLGVLRLSVAGLDKKGADMTTPFKGYQLGASARLLDVQVLPTVGLKNLLPKNVADGLPSSLAQLSLGEQVARAYAPAGGVQCGTTKPPAPAPGGGQQPGGVPKNLAYTAGAYSAVPLFWSGTAMLLVGVVLVAAMPGRRRRPVPVTQRPFKPSPRPRD